MTKTEGGGGQGGVQMKGQLTLVLAVAPFQSRTQSEVLMLTIDQSQWD